MKIFEIFGTIFWIVLFMSFLAGKTNKRKFKEGDCISYLSTSDQEDEWLPRIVNFKILKIGKSSYKTGVIYQYFPEVFKTDQCAILYESYIKFDEEKNFNRVECPALVKYPKIGNLSNWGVSSCILTNEGRK